MRNAFAKSVTEIISSNKKSILLVGDIGNKLFDSVKNKSKDRFINCGIAEANMTSVAAGLAMNGFKPITYTIAPFNVFRNFEQIRLDICYHNLPVTIVGTGAGLSYASLGPTHHSLEDIAVLKALPNIKLLCPGDPVEVDLALKETLNETCPVYIRLGKKGEPVFHSSNLKFKIGKVIKIKTGSEISLITMGNTMKLAFDCLDELEKRNISTELVSFHTIRPLDKNFLKKTFETNKKIFIFEEHGSFGGLLSSFIEFAYKNNYNTKNIINKIYEPKFLSFVGTQKNARKKIGLDKNMIIRQILKACD